MFGHRRPFSVDGGPSTLLEASRPYDQMRDIQFADIRYRIGPFGVVLWTFTLNNRNNRVAYREVRYQTTYRDAKGDVVDQGYDYIKDIFEPGALRQIEVNDGIIRVPFTSATIVLTAAEALLPAVTDAPTAAPTGP